MREAKVGRTHRSPECSSKVGSNSHLQLISSPKNFSPDPKMFFSGLVVTCAEVYRQLELSDLSSYPKATAKPSLEASQQMEGCMMMS